ncbi:VOC family protein [Maritimibacter sp. UBA3975]|uniref:VOC family protein n=1 Tax=Maritimibacter sp. UBA3975 TaxID=1946833 RepID=UPI000C0AA0B8|nr:VOC family protein [Maritimibacter sp. UBA3975]MAM62054.1 glyoxalase [Maritimibacter sp.]|tara:strand:- start:17628 stop:17990 length:363 start_codon:yes stop_codon:yes gene_type:complete
MTTQPIVVWGEIPVKNLEASAAFYDTVFGWTSAVDRSGPQPMVLLNGAGDTVGANLFEGESATGNIIHFAVPDSCEAAADRVSTAGGKVLSPPIEIPPGRFVMALDPDGNQIGLFQARDA